MTPARERCVRYIEHHLFEHADSTGLYGVGMDSNIVTASIKALLSGVNRLGDAGQSATCAKAA